MGGKHEPGLGSTQCHHASYLSSVPPNEVVVMSTEPFPGGHDSLRGPPGASEGKDILFRDFNRQV